MQLTRHRVGLFIALGTLAASFGCHSPGAAGNAPIKAASNFLHPPFSSQDDSGNAEGLEVELVAAAANRMGRKVQWIELPFGELLDAVATEEVDISASTIGITAERAKRVAFSDPYFTTTIVALVRPGAGEPHRLEDLSGRKIGTEIGTTAVPAAAQRLPEAIRVLERSEGNSWAEMLSNGQIDAVVLDHSHASKFMADANMSFFIIEEPLQEEHFAFALNLEDDVLRQELNRAIEDRSR